MANQERVEIYSKVLTDPVWGKHFNSEANDMYRNSLRQLGLPEEDIRVTSEQFIESPLTVAKIETAHACRLAADRLSYTHVSETNQSELEFSPTKR